MAIKASSCLVCKKRSMHKLFSAENKGIQWKYYRCYSCDLIKIHPIPSKQQLRKIYSYSNEEKQARTNRIINLLYKLPLGKILLSLYNSLLIGKRYSMVLKLANRGSLLDVGCGSGHFLSKFQDQNIIKKGIEVNKTLAELARQRIGKENVYVTKIESFRTAAKFEVITLWHTLEHLAKPDKILNKLNSLLSKNGKLVIEVPNGQSLARKVFSRHWQLLMPGQHLYFFSEKSLRKLLEKNGFKVLKINYYGIVSYSLSSSVANLLISKGLNFTLSVAVSLILFLPTILFNFCAFKWRENLMIIAVKK